MKDNIEKIRKKHAKEIRDYRDRCPHEKISDWVPYIWAPGHYGDDVKYCLRCDKIMEEKGGEENGGGCLVENGEGILRGSKRNRVRCSEENT
jgi:hypothetical protein